MILPRERQPRSKNSLNVCSKKKRRKKIDHLAIASKFLNLSLRDFRDEGLESYDIMLILHYVLKLAQGSCQDHAMVAAAIMEVEATFALFHNTAGDPA